MRYPNICHCNGRMSGPNFYPERVKQGKRMIETSRVLPDVESWDCPNCGMIRGQGKIEE